MNWSWKLPAPGSLLGAEIDSIYYMILIITGVIFLLVEATLVFFVLRYRHKEGRQASYVHGHTKTEVIWTLVPLVLVLWIVFASMNVWLEAKASDRRHDPATALPLRVTAKQFEWNVTYPGPDGRLDTEDDFVKRNQLQLPVDRDVRVELMSEDVIHSFFLPVFRVKQDAVPGMRIAVWFRTNAVGEFPLGCAELCGLGHYRMRGAVTVHEQAAFDRWMSEEAGTEAGAEPAPAASDTSQVAMEHQHEEDHR
jgi:cytochrome c oxidase subunit II